ncbi:VOC family protein [Roseomonas marmotae]|uniref:VOC family protein n=1 Tax=Roseomonas marmotae TaxID=2768161 RepID=A0ABS3KIV3_9PROT|nr:VOC family protein [Roseomonas marmotae]MBO1076266.1 VOC family protein [Roseomonas marmotae]QTI77852.1 VOC family protein [Roseomonas marmotae]
MRFSVDRLDHLVITCRDVEISASWYQRVLGMDREAFGEKRRTALRFGGQKINLRPAAADQEDWSSSRNAQVGTMDLCFVVAVSGEDIVTHLRECGVAIEDGPAPKVGALGPIMSVYCRDPDGNLIEISTYSR